MFGKYARVFSFSFLTLFLPLSNPPEGSAQAWKWPSDLLITTPAVASSPSRDGRRIWWGPVWPWSPSLSISWSKTGVRIPHPIDLETEFPETGKRKDSCYPESVEEGMAFRN